MNSLDSSQQHTDIINTLQAAWMNHAITHTNSRTNNFIFNFELNDVTSFDLRTL